jgi:hypothetical protein
MLMQVGNDLIMPDESVGAGSVPVVLRYERAGVRRRASEAMTRDGRLLELIDDRAAAPPLRASSTPSAACAREQTAFSSAGSLNVHSVWLVTNTGGRPGI